jgi:ABC-type multidrug transport system fused ATPase/permease subunit
MRQRCPIVRRGFGMSTLVTDLARPYRGWEVDIVNAADEFIGKLPEHYDTIVGERGATLSGGQRQRIGMARAFIRDAPILILHEPTASLDAESESLVIEGLQRLMKDRTMFMITHRLHTPRDAQMIVVLRDGVIAEKGRHDDLLARNGIYSGLYWAAPDRAALSPTWPAH